MENTTQSATANQMIAYAVEQGLVVEVTEKSTDWRPGGLVHLNIYANWGEGTLLGLVQSFEHIYVTYSWHPPYTSEYGTHHRTSDRFSNGTQFRSTLGGKRKSHVKVYDERGLRRELYYMGIGAPEGAGQVVVKDDAN
jgi:hypothetical protein